MDSEAEHIVYGGFRPRTKLNVWQWAEKNVILSARVTPHPGPYRTEWCPYVREPQEAFTDPDVQSIVMCWSSRSSKTESLLNCVRYGIAEDPQATLMVMPTEKLGRSFCETRFHPSINDSPVLAAEKPENSDQFKLLEMHMKRCSIFITGANSPANLKGRGITNLFCDEIDTWPEGTTKETGALQQVLERTKDRWNRKHLISSTPTIESGQIWREFLLGDQRYFFVPCSHCKEMQRLQMKQLKWSEEAKTAGGIWDLRKVKETAFYECEACQKAINDSHKPEMLKYGRWRPTVETEERGTRSYHLNSFYPVWISFSEIAVAFLQSLGNTEQKQRFINSWLAEPYYLYGDQKEQEAQIIALRDEKAPDCVPEGYKAIMTVDVQQDRLYAVVRAWNKEGESGLLEAAVVPAFEEAEIVAKRWGSVVVFMDARYRQQLVVEWCALHPGWIPMMGAAGLFTAMRWVNIPIDGGLLKGRNIRSVRYRPDDYKEQLWLRMKKLGPKWRLPPDPPEFYKNQMTGERRVERKGPRGKTMIEWIKVHENHCWDCEVAQLMAFESVRAFIFDVPAPTDMGPPQMSQAEVERAEMIQQRNKEIWGGGEQISWE